MHIQTHSGMKLGGSGRPPLPFLKIKKVPDFGKKSPDCVHLWIKFSIQNVVLRVSQRKNSQKVCLQVFLSCFDKMFIEVR